MLPTTLAITNDAELSEPPHLTKHRILEKHLAQLHDNHILQSHTLQIIEIFGGIDQIITNYLSSNDIQLTQTQLLNIQQILSNESIPSKNGVNSTSNTPKIVRTVSKFQESNTKAWRYKFSKSNTYIHQLFSNDTAKKIISLLYNKFLLSLNVIGGLIWVIWAWLEYGQWSLTYDLYKLIFFSVLALYGTFFALTINKGLLRKSVHHFLFWFKLIVCVQGTICVIWLRYLAFMHGKVRVLQIWSDVIGRFCTFILVFILSAIDGYQLSRKAKIYCCSGISITFTILAFINTFLVDQEMNERATIHLVGWFSFSIFSISASSWRVLSIFLWKQTILLMIKKNECVNIRHSPYIEWID